jgi:hypothetical protein
LGRNQTSGFVPFNPTQRSVTVNESFDEALVTGKELKTIQISKRNDRWEGAQKQLPAPFPKFEISGR